MANLSSAAEVISIARGRGHSQEQTTRAHPDRTGEVQLAIPDSPSGAAGRSATELPVEGFYREYSSISPSDLIQNLPILSQHITENGIYDTENDAREKLARSIYELHQELQTLEHIGGNRFTRVQGRNLPISLASIPRVATILSQNPTLFITPRLPGSSAGFAQVCYFQFIDQVQPQFLKLFKQLAKARQGKNDTPTLFEDTKDIYRAEHEKTLSKIKVIERDLHDYATIVMVPIDLTVLIQILDSIEHLKREVTNECAFALALSAITADTREYKEMKEELQREKRRVQLYTTVQAVRYKLHKAIRNNLARLWKELADEEGTDDPLPAELSAIAESDEYDSAGSETADQESATPAANPAPPGTGATQHAPEQPAQHQLSGLFSLVQAEGQ